jgi:hypothetical protein
LQTSDASASFATCLYKSIKTACILLQLFLHANKGLNYP